MNRVDDSVKMKFIYNAIEKGFSVKKLPELNNSYEFKLSLDGESFSPTGVVKDSRRSISEPITRRDIKEDIIKSIFR